MRVTGYEIMLFDRKVKYEDQPGIWTKAQVRLHGESSGERVMLIFFDPDLTNLEPANTSADVPVIFLRADQYVRHVDLLRNEGPIDIIDDPSTWRFGSLRTASIEPVGEGE